MNTGRTPLPGNHHTKVMTERPVTKTEVITFVCTLAVAAFIAIIARV